MTIFSFVLATPYMRNAAIAAGNPMFAIAVYRLSIAQNRAYRANTVPTTPVPPEGRVMVTVAPSLKALSRDRPSDPKM
ncbi:MAG: hypothetical protein RMI00_06450 [Sulfolobales archaeon]|nr:hypothetical protein [Sulfolobales archaeon]